MSHYNKNQIDEMKVVCAPQETDTKNWRLIFQILFHILIIMTLVINYLLFVCHLFLWMGKMFDFFQLSWNIPWLIQFLNRITSGFTIAESHIFNMLIDISCLCAVHGSRALITLMIFKLIFKLNWRNRSICHIPSKIRNVTVIV